MDRIFLRVLPASELTWSLSPDARRRLLTANKGFDAESRLADLELQVALELATKTRSAPAKVGRARAALVVQIVDQFHAALAGLLQYSQPYQEFMAALARAGKASGWLNEVEQDLGVIASAAREARHKIPGHGGRARLELRDGLILRTCGWVKNLQPIRARDAVRGALSRNAKKDPLHLPLQAPRDNLDWRRVESVKIILGEAGLPTGPDLRTIVRKTLGKKPTQK